MSEELFSVYFIYPDGSNTRERSFIPAKEAVKFALQATRRPAAALGILREIMITDGGDCCVWHWTSFTSREPSSHEGKEGANGN